MSSLHRQLLGKKGFKASIPTRKKTFQPSFSKEGGEVWRDVYNQKNDECRWPTTKFGEPVIDCNFVYEIYKIIEFNGRKENGDGVLILVKIPKNSKIYHAATIYPKEEEWFKKSFPFNSEKGVVWFTSTPEHSGSLSKTHLLEYIVEEELVMIYEQNISKKYGRDIRGYEYSRGMLGHYIKMIKDHIDGYIGCNECELGILNESCKKLSLPPKVYKEIGMKYFD